MELAELPQALDCEDARIVEFVLLSFLLSTLLAIDRFVGDCASDTTAKIHKVPRLAVSAPTIAQNFAFYYYAPMVLGHLEYIGG